MLKFMAILFIALCLVGSFAEQSYGAVVTVEMVNLTFVPAQVNINLGDTIRWINLDNVHHTATSGVPGATTRMWNSSHLENGKTYEFTFNSVGSFKYFCVLHPTTMTGTVVVTDPATNSSTPNLDPALFTDKTTYAKGEMLMLSGQVTSQMMMMYDIYIIAETPTGNFYSVNSNQQFGAQGIFFPYFTTWHSTTIPKSDILMVTVGDILSGNYVFHVIFVNQGASLADTSRWQATAEVAFTIQ